VTGRGIPSGTRPAYGIEIGELERSLVMYEAMATHAGLGVRGGHSVIVHGEYGRDGNRNAIERMSNAA
jgi:hypothetical protein